MYPLKFKIWFECNFYASAIWRTPLLFHFCKIIKSFKQVLSYISNCVNYKLEAEGPKILIKIQLHLLITKQEFSDFRLHSVDEDFYWWKLRCLGNCLYHHQTLSLQNLVNLWYQVIPGAVLIDDHVLFVNFISFLYLLDQYEDKTAKYISICVILAYCEEF